MKLHIFKDGSVVLHNEDETLTVEENGLQPVQILEATKENIQKYFPNNEKQSKVE